MNPAPSISIPEISLRDYFALSASEEDIQQWKYHIPTVLITVKMGAFGEQKITKKELPLNWREQARYLFADHMLEARSPK